MEAMDPSLLQDFLTESGELIDQLDIDLVKLEAADQSESSELCNSCFRALHTIKGAASFLDLTAVTTFAHAAEDTLNCLRKGELQVNARVMDALLRSADVVREQIAALCAGEEAPDGPGDLIELLHDLASNTPTDQADAEQQCDAGADDMPGAKLELPPQKADLLDFMVGDLQDYSKQLDEVFAQVANDATRSDAAAHLAEIADNMIKTADFFELDDLITVVRLLDDVAQTLADCPHELLDELVIRLGAVKYLIDQQAEALNHSRVLSWPLETFVQRVKLLAEHQSLDSQLLGKHQGDVAKLLVLDGLVEADEESVEDSPAASAAQPPSVPAQAKTDDKAPGEKVANRPAVEQTIRVEVGRLESLLNLVGQLVLNKNRVLALTRNLRDGHVSAEVAEDFAGAAGDLDRLMGELQVGVMRTRMQPLAKLFDRYPRVIRDIARATDKKIDLQIEGKDTEVDKSVLEHLADPLVHILRNSADHGVESPAKRREAGKNELGVIKLCAQHQGSHVRVAIEDDGNGLDREVLGNKAVEKGLVSAEKLAQLSDEDVFRFIFEAGFSTAKEVSNLSGRGVGMDVVRTNVNKLNGTINITSKKGQGTTIEILIPLTVAIMPAMVVGVGDHIYSVPLQSIVEIVKPEAQTIHTIKGQKVMRLRNSVLPLVNMQERLNETASDDGGRFAVVVGIGGQRAGLLVDRLIGQQEIVIKPLDDSYTHGGPFSGATIQEDGEVSLILDVIQIIRKAQASAPSKAAA